VRNASKGGKPDRSIPPLEFTNPYFTKQSISEGNSSIIINDILLKDKNEGRNLNSEKSQDYAQKPQQNCTFMNSTSGQNFRAYGTDFISYLRKISPSREYTFNSFLYNRIITQIKH
jgi:hypothetical protein